LGFFFLNGFLDKILLAKLFVFHLLKKPFAWETVNKSLGSSNNMI
jgi:hypothetical protein